MSDTRISAKSTPTPKKAPATPVAPTAGPAKPAAAPTATDSLKTTKPAPAPVDTKAVIEEALAIPPMPNGEAAQRSWLIDGYTRMLKAVAAERLMAKEAGTGKVDTNQYYAYVGKINNMEKALKQAPHHDAVKKEFFEGILVPAQALMDDLARFPEAPKDKAGKIKWLEEGKGMLEKAKAADKLLHDAWFRFDALEFGKMADSGSALVQFDWKLSKVERELNPPAKPKPGEKGKSNPAGRPLFELTQAAQKGLDSKNPVGQTAGAIAMPIALTIDVIDMITRPFQWMDSLKNNQ